jgi:hypothetical protein
MAVARSSQRAALAAEHSRRVAHDGGKAQQFRFFASLQLLQVAQLARADEVIE